MAFSVLKKVELLNQANLHIITRRTRPGALAIALAELHKAKILSAENQNIVSMHLHPLKLCSAFISLHQSGLLTSENRNVIIDHVHLPTLALVLTCLMLARILNQDNLSALVAPKYAILTTEEVFQNIWSRIPQQQLTQANFIRLLAVTEHANPMAELERVRDHILGAGHHAAIFNPRQSTHTASVHQSVTASAEELLRNYGHLLNLDQIIQELTIYVRSLDDSPKHQAAKRCITRITATDYTFTDTSGISTRRLLALAYTAIHDESKRSGALEDAKRMLVEGLYEIQRGYNLNPAGEDRGGEDEPICAAGTFNKLMEKLNGIHNDVMVYFITHEGASSKFPRLAGAHAKAYLELLARPATARDYPKVKDLLERLKQDDSLELIWGNIKAGVETELWDEFKTAYGDNPRDARFLALINNGHYLALPDLSAIETALQASPGYQAYLEEQMRLSLGEQRLILSLEQHGLWANRHSNLTAQAAFDKQYSLVAFKP